VVTDQATADGLPTVETAEEDFKRVVLEVNAEFAEGYDAVVGVGPNPETEFNPDSVEPQIGADSEVGEFARMVGNVRLEPGSEVSDRAAIRADEGSPMIIGENAKIDERVTFHALEETSITVGDNLVAGDDSVLHGPLEIGNNLTVADDSVVFRVDVGDNVIVGEGVIIQGPARETEDPENLTLAIPDGAVSPDGAVVTVEASLEEALSETPGDAGDRRRRDGEPGRGARPLGLPAGTAGGDRVFASRSPPCIVLALVGQNPGGRRNRADRSNVGCPRRLGAVSAGPSPVHHRGDQRLRA
jgi:carbonic anhydrase/acetyltransferase-like protein (isoleucine patch superfamily)